MESRSTFGFPLYYNLLNSVGRNRTPSLQYASAEEYSTSDFFESDTTNERPGQRSLPGIYGNYRPIFNGLCVIGPGKVFFCTTLLLFLGLLANMSLQCRYVEVAFGKGVPYVGIALWFLSFCFIICTATTDPGIMPRNIGFGDHSVKYPRNPSRELGLPPRFCYNCGLRRPPRTYHCTFCNICVRYRDLHVHCLGTCVGERNFCYFYVLSLFLASLSAYLLTINSLLLKDIYARRWTSPIWDVRTVNTMIGFLYGLVLCLLPQTGIIVILYRFYLVAKDRTCHEEYRVIKLGVISAEGGRNPLRTKTYCQTFLEYLNPSPRTKSYLNRWTQISPIGNPRELFRNFSNSAWSPNDVIARSEQHLLDELSRTGRQLNSVTQQRENCNKLDLFGNAASARRRAFFSMPMLNDGEVGRLPGSRQRYLVRSRPKDRLTHKLIDYQELMETPRAIADTQFRQHRFSRSLSLGDLPRSPWNATTENEIVYQAQATQIQAVIQLILRRDRLGLVAMSRRLNLGALMGLQELDPDNLQIIELNNNGIPILGGRRAPRRQLPRGSIGISQMVAAGLMSRLDGTILREMVPPLPPQAPALLPPRPGVISIREVQNQFQSRSYRIENESRLPPLISLINPTSRVIRSAGGLSHVLGGPPAVPGRASRGGRTGRASRTRGMGGSLRMIDGATNTSNQEPPPRARQLAIEPAVERRDRTPRRNRPNPRT